MPVDPRGRTPSPKPKTTPTLPDWLTRILQPVANVANKTATTVSTTVGKVGPAVASTGTPSWLKMSPTQRGAALATTAGQLGTLAMKWATRNQPNNPAFRGGGGPTGAPVKTQPRPGVEGVNYGPNWTRSDYIEPPTWRQENPEIQMSPDEYIARRNAVNNTLPSYQDWQKRAYEAATTLPPELYNQWKDVNPSPSGFWQTANENAIRQNYAPSGTVYMPFGATYYPKPTLPAENAGANGTPGAGGGYGGGWGGWGGGGGGGGGPRSYPEALQSYYNSMVSWIINQANRGG